MKWWKEPSLKRIFTCVRIFSFSTAHKFINNTAHTPTLHITEQCISNLIEIWNAFPFLTKYKIEIWFAFKPYINNSTHQHKKALKKKKIKRTKHVKKHLTKWITWCFTSFLRLWVSVWVVGFSEAERPECLGECVDLGLLRGKKWGPWISLWRMMIESLEELIYVVSVNVWEWTVNVNIWEWRLNSVRVWAKYCAFRKSSL